jgi:hypothetical protein
MVHLLTFHPNQLLNKSLSALVAKSEDVLTNPLLYFENVCRVKHLVDTVSYTSAVAVLGDCTKVWQCIIYSTNFGSHILGSDISIVLLDQCEVEEIEDIDKIIAKMKQNKVMATQV